MFVIENRALRRSLFAVALCGFGAALTAGPAMARAVDISGTHSKSEIKADCDAVGGMMVEGDGGKGYGCYNYHKNTMVACDDKGVCTGFVPLKGQRPRNRPVVPASGWTNSLPGEGGHNAVGHHGLGSIGGLSATGGVSGRTLSLPAIQHLARPRHR